jgi:predicted kinase
MSVGQQVKIVCGAPGSGKTTWVKNNMKPGDLVMDQDALYAALSFQPVHSNPSNLLPIVLSMRYSLFNIVEKNYKAVFDTFWIITSGASVETREQFEDRYQATIFVLLTPAEECIRRITTDEIRNKNMDFWSDLVNQWWKNYHERVGDTLVTYQRNGG